MKSTYVNNKFSLIKGKYFLKSIIVGNFLYHKFLPFAYKLRKGKESICNFYPDLLKTLEITCIFDIGANVGQFAIGVRASGFQGKIISFEPQIDCHSRLKKRSRYDAKWSIYKPCALGSSSSKGSLNISTNSVSSSLLDMEETALDYNPGTQFIKTQEIEIIKLSDVIQTLDIVDSNLMIKIDTQGSELDVLIGIEEKINKFKIILLEVSLLPIYRPHITLQQIINYLENLGFELWDIKPVFRDTKTKRLLQVDALFVRAFK